MITASHDGRTSFSQHNPWLQIAWDSTSLGAAKECARKYVYSIVLGYRGKFESLHLRYGQLYHRALEVYDHARFTGADHTAAQVAMLRDLAEGCQNLVPNDHSYSAAETVDAEDLLAQPADSFVADATKDGAEMVRVWWNPSEGLSDEKAKANTKTIANLFRTVVWYTEFFLHDPLQTVKLANGKPAVELSFRFNLGTEARTGESFMYSGHLDRLVEQADGSKWVVDRKTTKNTIGFGFFQSYSPDNQMSGYTLAGNVVLDIPVKGVIIDAVQITHGFSRFVRGNANRTPGLIEEWLNTTRFYIGTLFQLYAESAQAGAGVDAYPMNDKACHNYGGCPFRDTVCSKDPAVREPFLKANFRVQKWDPLETRGDV
jgi:hypothetical protein